MIPLNSKQNNYNKTLIVSRFISHIPSTRYLHRCRRSTMPPHRFLPPPCTDTTIYHFVSKN